MPRNAAARRVRRRRARRRRAGLVRRVRRRRRLSQAFGEEAATVPAAALPRPPSAPRHHRGLRAEAGHAHARREQRLVSRCRASALSIPSQAGELARRRRGLVDPRRGCRPGRDFLEFTLKSNADLQEAAGASREARRSTMSSRRSRHGETGWKTGIPATCGPPSGASSRPRAGARDARTSSCAASAARRVRRPDRGRRARRAPARSSALRGFTRINAPDDLRRSRRVDRAALARATRRGCRAARSAAKGSSSASPRSACSQWEHDYRDSGAAGVLRDGHRGWRARRGLTPTTAGPASATSCCTPSRTR